MSGRKRLAMIEEKIARVERLRGADAVASWLRTLSPDTLAELQRRLEGGDHPAAIVEDMKLL